MENQIIVSIHIRYLMIPDTVADDSGKNIPIKGERRLAPLTDKASGHLIF
jgi:hypothetical protein